MKFNRSAYIRKIERPYGLGHMFEINRQGRTRVYYSDEMTIASRNRLGELLYKSELVPTFRTDVVSFFIGINS